MFGLLFPSIKAKTQYAEQPSIGFTPKIMVYEDVPLEPTRWEYKVVSIDTHERSLPDEDYLNELGSAGWLLVGVLQRPTSEHTPTVNYYFVRQILPVTKR